MPGKRSSPESEDVLESVNLFGDVLCANYIHDALGRVMRYSIDGGELGEVALPGLGSVSGFGGKRDDKETFFTFENYVTPSSIYRYDLESGETTLWREPKTLLNTDDYVTEQIFCESKDGTRVPIIVTRRKTTVFDRWQQPHRVVCLWCVSTLGQRHRIHQR